MVTNINIITIIDNSPNDNIGINLSNINNIIHNHINISNTSIGVHCDT